MTAHLNPILRLCVLVGWSLVILWSSPSYRNAMTGAADTGDYKQIALAIAGVSIVGYQIRALLLGPLLRQDHWATILLCLQAIGAAVIFILVHLPRTPNGHKRAVVFSHLALVALCIVGGTLG